VNECKPLEGGTRVIPFDIDDFLDIDKQCTSPNLMARLCLDAELSSETTSLE